MPRLSHAPGCACALRPAGGAEQSLDELAWARSPHGFAAAGAADKLATALARGGGGGAAAAAAVDCAGYTPLHYAARAGDARCVAALLAAGAPVDARTTGAGATPLMRAAAGGHAGVVEALLAAGADAAAVDGDGETAAHKAAAGGHAGVLATLLAAAPGCGGVRDRRGRTPGERVGGLGSFSGRTPPVV